MSYCAKRKSIPMQILLDAVFTDCRTPIEIFARLNNTQAMTVVHEGYTKNKKLWFLKRIHKCEIGAVHEFIESGQLRVQYAPTLTHRGDGFSKCLTPAKFFAARDMMSLVPNAGTR